MTAIRIGTRGSPLALAQAYQVRDRLRAAHSGLAADAAIEIVVIRTSGDRIVDRPLAEAGGKGLFTKEIDEAQLAGTVDIAVHSLKDVPTRLPDGLVLACVPEREDPRDAFLSPIAATPAELPRGAVVGTASLRRKAQVLELRPDLSVVTLRGNVQTRLKKLEDGAVAATFLAMAGLNRLGVTPPHLTPVSTDVMLPAVAQGAIGITCRTDDAHAHALLAPLDHAASHDAVLAERAFLAVLDGSCRTPIAGLAEIDGDRLRFRGRLLENDGRKAYAAAAEGPRSDAIAIGHHAGVDIGKRLGRRGLD